MTTKTQDIFNQAILKSAELCKMINEDGYDSEDKEVEKINDEISNLQEKLLYLPYDFGEYDEEEHYHIKDLDKYIKDVVGKNYFIDRRCWFYLYDIVYDIENDIGWNLMESKKSIKNSLNEKVTVSKSLKIIEHALLDLIHNDTIQEEFNMAFDDNNGIYDSVDDMFEVSVHNVLNKLLKEHTITVLPF